MDSTFNLNEDQKQWIARRRKRPKYKHYPEQYWEYLIQKQAGRCALTEAPLLFNAKNGTPKRGGKGCHPLYVSIDHINPGSEDSGLQIVCYDINDLKAHLPPPLFEALEKTRAWKIFKENWKGIAEAEKMTLNQKRKKLKQLIKNGE